MFKQDSFKKNDIKLINKKLFAIFFIQNVVI